VVATGVALDWNEDGESPFDDLDVSRNINFIQGVVGCEKDFVDSFMSGHDDWANMAFVSRTLPHFSDGIALALDDEPDTIVFTEFQVTPALAAETPAPDVQTQSETGFPDIITSIGFGDVAITVKGSASFGQTILSYDVVGTLVGGTVDALVINPLDPTEATTTFHPGGATNVMSFEYTITTDTPRTSDPVTVTILQNNAPVANPQSIITSKNNDVTIRLVGTDADGDTLQFSIDDLDDSLTNLTPIPPTQADVTFSPDLEFVGDTEFTFYVIDEFGASSNVATVTVSVIEGPSTGNNPPTALDDSANTLVETPIDIPVLDNDDDADGDPLEVTIVSDPSNGLATINPDGTIEYTPDADFTGVDTFTYTISDGAGGTDTATVTVTVRHVIDSFMTDSKFAGINSFDIVFTKDKSSGMHKIRATNPGTYYYNTIITNTGPTDITAELTLDIPPS